MRTSVAASLACLAGVGMVYSQVTARKRPTGISLTSTSTIETTGKRDSRVDKVYADALGSNDSAPDYRELRCRGGVGMQFVEVDGRLNSSGEQTTYITVYFKPGAKAAAYGRDLQPGQCAYPDRILRENEPNEIFVEMVYFGQLRQQLHGSPVDTSATAAERFPDAQNLPKYLGDSNHYWSFYVHQNAPLPFGRFDASGSRYWKPALTGSEPVVPVASKIGNKSDSWVITPKKP